MNICNYPDDCGTCEVNGAIQQGNTHFEYDLNGLRMSCKCNCDSSYICIAEWINYISEATAFPVPVLAAEQGVARHVL